MFAAVETERGISLDDLQQETEKLLVLLKDRQPGLITWNACVHHRLTKLNALISKALSRGGVDGND